VQVVAVRPLKNKSTVIPGPSNSAADTRPAVIISNYLTDGMGRSTLFGRGIKRAFDIVVASVGLILFSPIFLLSSLAIKIESRGPAFDRQQRHSYYNNESIEVFMFRCTKIQNCKGAVRATRKRVCVTRIGGILRSSGIDGLPQLFNVLRGEMSIVGPRAFTAFPGAIFEEEILRTSRRRNFKPGLTSLAQVYGYGEVSNSFGVMLRRVEYDLYYIKNWSFLFDMKIIVMALCSKKNYALTEWTGER
jgi:lipopolysaccharide/colanic/teichoic acid biosynthesis glycosyltransferase